MRTFSGRQGKYVIKCCGGTACHVKKSDNVQAGAVGSHRHDPSGQHTSETACSPLNAFPASAPAASHPP